MERAAIPREQLSEGSRRGMPTALNNGLHQVSNLSSIQMRFRHPLMPPEFRAS
jgi:hypothetical protein